MCGLIGYSGRRQAKDVLLPGLERLEYRGYDSAGICLRESNGLSYVRAVGNLTHLKASVNGNHSSATSGIGHTRWATHGRVSITNTHPLAGCDEDEVAIVLNGIVENFFELRQRLSSKHLIHSETDAEMVAHLIEEHYEGDLVEAVRSASGEIEGHFAFVVIHRDHPGLLVGTRLQCPLVVGLAEDETFIASMIAAFAGDTRLVKFVEDGDVVAISPEGARFVTRDGEEVEREVFEIDWDDEVAQHDGHESFMLKEIHEQPEAVGRTLAGRTRSGRVELGVIGLDDESVRALRRIVIVACGTAYHASLMGRYAIEKWARIVCEPDIASEWRYRDPLLDRDTLVIGISQSGETADTIAALHLARALDARTLAITNTIGSQITREADDVLYTRAGLEMGVAATKTFTAQASLMYLLALSLAQTRGTLSTERTAELLGELDSLPSKLAATLLATEHATEKIARRFHAEPFFLYLGRHIGLPVCLEGALKLKEISYIPTEAYSAGEMKHGPIALLDETTPVVCIAIDGHVYDKVVSNIQEVRARGAQVIAIASDGNEEIQHLADEVIYVPRADPFVQALLAVVPLQLLAYRISQLRGLNVDQPRNLAKTVTVE